MSNFKTVDLKILNKEFQVNCPNDTESQLYAAADHLDQKMREIRSNGRVIGLERIAIMAALNISHELLIVKQQKEAYLQSMVEQIERLQNKIDEALI